MSNNKEKNVRNRYVNSVNSKSKSVLLALTILVFFGQTRQLLNVYKHIAFSRNIQMQLLSK